MRKHLRGRIEDDEQVLAAKMMESDPLLKHPALSPMGTAQLVEFTVVKVALAADPEGADFDGDEVVAIPREKQMVASIGDFECDPRVAIEDPAVYILKPAACRFDDVRREFDDMGKLEGKVAIVTGGSRGIGKAIAHGLAAEGAKVVIAARGAEKLTEAAQELSAGGTAVIPIPADVTVEGQVTALFQRTLELFHRLDVLVNSAGVFDGGLLDELSVETWDKVISVNLRGPFLCTRAALRIMKPQRSGRILNIGSIAAQRPRLKGAAYAASKFGL